MDFFLVYGSMFSFCYHTFLTKTERVAPGFFVFEAFTGLWLSTSTFCMKCYDYDKGFVRVLVLSVMTKVCPKKLLKNGEH